MQELWRELERRLSALLDALAVHIDGENLALLRDFVENREFGIALEWLDSLIVERTIPLLPDQAQEIERLAATMKINLDESRGSTSNTGLNSPR